MYMKSEFLCVWNPNLYDVWNRIVWSWYEIGILWNVGVKSEIVASLYDLCIKLELVELLVWN